MPSQYTNEEIEVARRSHRPAHRTQQAARKAVYRRDKAAERRRQALAEGEDLFQPPTTPQSYQHEVARHQLPVTATHSSDEQAANRYFIHETAMQLADRVEHVIDKLREREADTGRVIGMFHEHAKDVAKDVTELREELTSLISRIRHTELREGLTLPVSDISAVSMLTSVDTPGQQTSFNTPLNAGQDLSFGFDLLRASNENAARADDVGNMTQQTTNEQAVSAYTGDVNPFADGFGEDLSNDLLLWGVDNQQHQDILESLGIEDNEGEQFDFNQYLNIERD